MIDVAALRELAEAAARAGGELIRAGLAEDPDARAVESTKSTPTDIVTAMDEAVEKLLRERLSAARPEDGLLGEEAGFTPGRSGLSWVLDPIDGTVNYRYGIDAYAVSVAVVEGDPTVDGAWTPVAGCVHNPATGDTWTAGRGLGARLAPGAGSSARARTLGPGPGWRSGRRAPGRAGPGADRGAPAGPRHPADRERVAGPVRGGDRHGGRVLRAGRERLGHRRGDGGAQ